MKFISLLIQEPKPVHHEISNPSSFNAQCNRTLTQITAGPNFGYCNA